MNRTKYLKSECQHCGGHLEFPAEHIGSTVSCPHCGQETELTLLPPKQEATVPPRTLIWTGIAVLVLGLGFGGALVALKRAERWAEKQKREAGSLPVSNIPSTAVVTNAAVGGELASSGIALEKTPGSSLVYATGTVTNSSRQQRFGVKVELELLDVGGRKVGTASDYRQTLEPGAQWQFKALVVESKAKSARIMSIKEDQ